MTVRSKAHWGYDRAFMEWFAPLCRVESRMFEEGWFTVAEAGGRAAAFSWAWEAAPVLFLESLFVDAEFIGQGIGGQLWDAIVALGRSRGLGWVGLEADPFARPFYVSRGCIEIGERPAAEVIPGRVLPIMTFAL